MRRMLIVAGESSGDSHAARLLREMRADIPGVQVYACGGKALKEEGADMLADLVSLSVVGAFEVLKKYSQIRAVFRDVVAFLQRERPDAVVLVDYPGFNLRLAREAKKLGIPVIYYVSPQVWAWAPGRVGKIKQCVDLMLVLFPFEEKLYEKAGVPVRYVGHPSLDKAQDLPAASEWLVSQGLPADAQIVGLLPGSRTMEIERIFPVQLESARIILAEFPKALFMVPCAAGHLRGALHAMVEDAGLKGRVRIVEGQSMEVTRAARLALVASGTATLETALTQTPMLLVYKVHPFTYWIGRALVRIGHLGLVNVLAGRTVAPEFLQGRARADLLAAEACDILRDANRHRRMQEELKGIREGLGRAGASRRAAHAIVGWLYPKVKNELVSTTA